MKESKFQYSKYKSGELVNGIERAAHRALLYSTGLDEEDLRKPLVAVVNSFTEMVPGHIHLRELAEHVKNGIWEAGGVPREFSTIGHELSASKQRKHCRCSGNDDRGSSF